MEIGPIDSTGGATPPDSPPSPSEAAGVSPEAVADAKVQVTRYLDVQHSARQPSASGKMETVRTTINHGPEALPNSRSTAEGRSQDAKTREGVFRQTGMDFGHNAPTSAGADPADKLNGSPQNSIQNRSGGTWYNAEGRMRQTLKSDSGSIKRTDIDVHYKPGSDVPTYRTMTHTMADGTQLEGNIHYGNFPSASSRRADQLAKEGKQLEPGEGDRLNAQQKAAVAKQADVSPEEHARLQAEWNQNKAARGIGVEPEPPKPTGGGSTAASAIEGAAEDAGKLGKFVKGAGVVGMAVGAYDLGKAAEQSYQEGSIVPVAKEAAKQVGGWAGAAAGAEAGAAIGAALGIESGPGAIVTGAIGGLVGGIAGSLGVSVSIDAITSLF